MKGKERKTVEPIGTPQRKTGEAKRKTTTPVRKAPSKTDVKPKPVVKVVVKVTKKVKESEGSASSTKTILEHGSEFGALPWYQGAMPKDEVETMLTQDGDFALRLSLLGNDGHMGFFLSFRNTIVYHVVVRETDKGWSTAPKGTEDGVTGKTMTELIQACHAAEVRPGLGMLKKGTTRSNYLLRAADVKTQSEIGSGKYGVVYKGTMRDPTSGDESVVVVKMTKKLLIEKERQEMIKEAIMLIENQHENIVVCYGLSLDIFPMSIVMELCGRGSLIQHLKKSGRTEGWPRAEKLKWSYQAACAHAFLAARKIIHRDVAARNCLIKGANSVLKVADFGMAKRLGSDGTFVSKSDKVLPVRWASPEAIQHQIFSEASDVFSYAVLVWEIYSNGAKPWPSDTPESVVRKVTKEGMRLQFKDQPPDPLLHHIYHGCFFPLPKDRPSFATIRDDVQPLVSGNKSKDMSTEPDPTADEPPAPVIRQVIDAPAPYFPPSGSDTGASATPHRGQRLPALTFHVWNDAWMKRPDLPPGYDGWQAVDSTPQEKSEGLYRVGPSSLKAIRNGDVALSYDTAFLFAEVNADKCYWSVDPSRRRRDKLLSVTRNEIGRQVVTKRPGPLKPAGDDLMDITGEYKHNEYTHAEREAVMNAFLHGQVRILEHYRHLEEIYEDVHFTLDISRSTRVGQDFHALLAMENRSSEPRTIKVTLRIHSGCYNGTLEQRLKTDAQTVVLPPGEMRQLVCVVSLADYAEKLSEQCVLLVSALGHVLETTQIYAGSDETRLEPPHINIEHEGGGSVGEPIRLYLSFQNPLPVTLSNCSFMVDGPGLLDSDRLLCPDVRPRGYAQFGVEVQPWRPGDHAFVVHFSSDQLKDINGSVNIHVEP